MRPDTVAPTSPWRRPMFQIGVTTWIVAGAADTVAGAGPSHRVRRSRQRTDRPPPVRCQEGVGNTAAVGGAVVVVVPDAVVAVTLLRATDGDRRFSNTPDGPTRR